MQIREIHIDGFGIFSNKQVTGLTSGLNVIYGENEAGKTTLIEFIRRMLFELPRRGKGFNSYPPLEGGRHGGKLKCLSASGEPWVLARKFSGKNGLVVSTPNAELKGQAALNALLSHATLPVFQNMFAFTLDELQSVDSLKGDEIRNRIYGPELGLGRVSLKRVEDTLLKKADDIFLPKGKKTEANILYQDIKILEEEIRGIQNEAGEYDRLMRHLETCEKQQRVRQIEIESLESLIRQVETRRQLKRTFDEEESVLHELNIEQGSLSVNHDLLTHEADVLFLQQSTQAIHSCIHDIVTLQQEKTELEIQIQARLQETGITWNEDKVKNFDFNRTKSDQIKAFLKDSENLRQDVTLARDRLEHHQEQKAEERSKGSNIPAWILIVAWTLCLFGLGGAAWSLIEKNIPVLVAAVIFMSLGLLIFWKTYKGKKEFDREDLLEKTLMDKLNRAQLAVDRNNLEWQAWLKKISLDETLEPLSAQDIGNTIKDIKGKIVHKTKLETRLQEMFQFEESVSHRIEKIKVSVPEKSLRDHIPTNIRIIGELFDTARDNQQSKNQIEKQIQQQTFKMEKLKHQLQETDRSLERVIDESGPDLETLLAGNRIFESVNSIEEVLNQLSSQLKKLEEEKNRLHETIGETRNKLTQLTSNEELLIKQENLEIKKANLKECGQQWCQAKIALFMLESAKSQYEKTRQPEVLKAAKTGFSQITGGKYTEIIKSPDDDFLVESNTGKRLNVTEMSRGTREQLYLCMRLGLIEEYESRSEPLPIIMDDVLVNFDDSRKTRVIETLKHFAQSRQMIVMTCHRTSLEDYLKSGAREIRV